jgi:hypothetical protein
MRRTEPEVGLISPSSILMVVDLPDPLGPRNPTISPLPTEKVTGPISLGP